MSPTRLDWVGFFFNPPWIWLNKPLNPTQAESFTPIIGVKCLKHISTSAHLWCSEHVRWVFKKCVDYLRIFTTMVEYIFSRLLATRRKAIFCWYVGWVFPDKLLDASIKFCPFLMLFHIVQVDEDCSCLRQHYIYLYLFKNGE